MNKLILMGRLVADPEFSMSQSGMPYCRFRIAVDRGRSKQGEERDADFFRVTAFGKTAELVNQYFVKGKPILIDGEVHNDNYTDKNGVQHYSVSVIANNVSFVLSDPTRNANGNGGNYSNNNYGNRNGGNYNNNYSNNGGYNNYGNNGGNYNNGGDFHDYGNDSYQNQPNYANAPQSAQPKDVQLGGDPAGDSDFSDFHEILSDGEVPF